MEQIGRFLQEKKIDFGSSVVLANKTIEVYPSKKDVYIIIYNTNVSKYEVHRLGKKTIQFQSLKDLKNYINNE
jgi:hypothetical protein